MKKADFENHLQEIETTSNTINGDDHFDPEEVWREAKEHLKQAIGQREFGGLFGNAYIEDINNGVVQISCDAAYKREKILKDYKYALQKALLKTCQRNFEIEVNLRESSRSSSKPKYEYHNPTDEDKE